jgi:non-ribosomal peptide synthetase component F
MPGAEKLPLAILETINKYDINIIHFVPSMLNVFLDHLAAKGSQETKKLSSVKRVFSSGEALYTSHVKKFYEIFGNKGSVILSNLYGPTETTVDVTYYDCQPEDLPNKIPIGKPIDNIKCFIVDKNGELVIDGAGELCISGVGLARGYMNNSKLTEERFCDNPFLPGEKMYKTGDIAQWLPDGNIEFLGREDYQVKISGMRIELGEIENTIRCYHSIRDAVVITKEYSETIVLIIAYISCKYDTDLNDLKNHLKNYLPEYMLPNHFEIIESIPLTENGKADRKNLPVPQIQLRTNTPALYS